MIYCFQIAICLVLLMTMETLENESDIQTIDTKNDKEHSVKTPVNSEPINEKIEKHTNHFYINNSTVNINIYGKMDDSNQSFRNENIGNLTQCKPIQQQCFSDYECCSKSCVGTFISKVCTTCKPANEICDNHDHCCSKKCIQQLIFFSCAACFDIGQNCDVSSKCCSGYCKLHAKPKPICSKAPLLLEDYIKLHGLLRSVNDNDTIESQAQQPNYDEYIPCSVIDHDEFKKNQRSGIRGEEYRWRTGLFIKFTTNFKISELKLIARELTILNNLLKKCIPIYVWPTGSIPTDKYVIIRRGLPGSGCWSEVGKQPLAPQILNLEPDGCILKGTVVHEVMHALGIFHEQSRPDRENHVNIFVENFDYPNRSNNFAIEYTSLTFNLPYNTKSIMHYDSYSFGRVIGLNKTLHTILKKNGGEIGKNKVMTDTDKKRLIAMYCNK